MGASKQLPTGAAQLEKLNSGLIFADYQKVFCDCQTGAGLQIVRFDEGTFGFFVMNHETAVPDGESVSLPIIPRGNSLASQDIALAELTTGGATRTCSNIGFFTLPGQWVPCDLSEINLTAFAAADLLFITRKLRSYDLKA